jgi:hypothetical protein
MTTVPFISWVGHGAANLAPPGVFTDAKGTVFVIDADKTAMQRLVEKLLNRAGAGKVRYEAALPISMVSFMDIARCTSGTDVVGWLPGRECAIWVPLLEFRGSNPLPDRLVFWAPYIFITYTLGLVIGRETWGWPKVLADISVPTDDPSVPRYCCATTYFPTLSADTKGVTGTLFQVVGDAAREQPAPATWRTAADARDALIESVLAGISRELLKPCSLLPHGPCVALKQFREAGDTQNACYQAICDSPVALTQFKGAGWLPGSFTLEIATCQSHQIVQDLLGRMPDRGCTRLPIKLAAWSLSDFQALPGDNIVVRP